MIVELNSDPNPLYLTWGVKSSFLSYLDGLEDSSVVTNDGARRDAQNGPFVFPFVSRKQFSSGELRFEFSGDLRFKAHDGMLLVIFMRPWITITPRSAELSVVDLMKWPDTSYRETLGFNTNEPGEPDNGVLEVPLKLSGPGVETFNNVYPEGTELAPANLVY